MSVLMIPAFESPGFRIRNLQSDSFTSSERRAQKPSQSDDTEARHSQGEQATARERLQAGSCRPAMMDVINLAGELRHSIETENQIHASLALQWDETKD